jgi:hypothetical protein
MNAGELQAKLKQARSCYEEFSTMHPDKVDWVRWRLKYLDLAARALAGKKR